MNIVDEITIQEPKVMVIEDGLKSHLKMMEDIGIKLIEMPEPESLIKRIRNVCRKYDLKCLKLSYYKRLIPVENLQEIIEYKKRNSYSNLVIIAPAEDFNTVSMSVKKADPVVIDLRSDSIVTTWGDDFSMFRRFRGFWTNPIVKMIRRNLLYPALAVTLASTINCKFAAGLATMLIAGGIILILTSLIDELENVYGWNTKDYTDNIYPNIPWWF